MYLYTDITIIIYNFSWILGDMGGGGLLGLSLPQPLPPSPPPPQQQKSHQPSFWAKFCWIPWWVSPPPSPSPRGGGGGGGYITEYNTEPHENVQIGLKSNQRRRKKKSLINYDPFQTDRPVILMSFLCGITWYYQWTYETNLFKAQSIVDIELQVNCSTIRYLHLCSNHNNGNWQGKSLPVRLKLDDINVV